MEQGPLLSNAMQQQSRKLAASLIAVNIASSFLLIIYLLSFEIINLVVETAVQIIAGAILLALLLELNSALRALFLISARLCRFILHCKQMMLSLLLRFGYPPRIMIKQAQNLVPL